MWLAGMKRPDFRTINYYCDKRLKEGFVSFKAQYIGVTKIEPSSNKYTFVWRGSVEKHDSKLKAKTAALLSQIEQNRVIENQENPLAEKLTAEEVAQRVEFIRSKVGADNLGKEDFPQNRLPA